MNAQRATLRIGRAISVLAVAAGAIFTGAGCTRLCGMLGRSEANKPEQPVFVEPGPVTSASVADASPAPELQFTALAPHQSDRHSDAATVNVFGEINGTSASPFKPVGESGFQQHTSLDEGEDGEVAVDPTGKWLAFASTRHNEAGDIYLQRAQGTSVTQLTNDAARDSFPAFSPDGKWIAFSSTRAGNWQIYRMDLDGRNVVQVTSGTMQAIHPSFSPDGTRLVYSAMGGRSGQWELWTVNLASGERRQVGYGLFPSWSPDKSVDRIAYQRSRQRGSRWFSLWTMDLIDGEGRRNTEVAVSNNAAIVSPCWSPDGKKLAFTTVVQNVEGSKGAGQQDVWTIDADGGNKQRLTDGNGTNLSPSWSPDNRVFFISNRGGNETIWSVHAGAGSAAAATMTADTKEVGH
jgi:TolB protein